MQVFHTSASRCFCIEFAFLICVIFNRGVGTSNFETDLYFKFNLVGILIAPLIIKLVHYLQFRFL